MQALLASAETYRILSYNKCTSRQKHDAKIRRGDVATRKANDIVISDNRCINHKVAGGDHPPDEDRIHWRVSIKEAAS